MILQSELQQTNGTLDSLHAYKRRRGLRHHHGRWYRLPPKRLSFTLSGPMSGGAPVGAACLAPPKFCNNPTVNVSSQTHNVAVDSRNVPRKKKTPGAVHRNVVQPASSGISFTSILLFGGLGYAGYKGYQYYKKKHPGK